jgi:hypothetical protein
LQKKIVLCGPRLAFQHDTFQALESPGERGRRYGIHISDGNILPGHAVHSPPLPTHKRHRRTILRILDKLKDTRQVLVRQYRHDVLLFRLHFLPFFHILFLFTSSTLSFNAKKKRRFSSKRQYRNYVVATDEATTACFFPLLQQIYLPLQVFILKTTGPRDCRSFPSATVLLRTA